MFQVTRFASRKHIESFLLRGDSLSKASTLSNPGFVGSRTTRVESDQLGDSEPGSRTRETRYSSSTLEQANRKQLTPDQSAGRITGHPGWSVVPDHSRRYGVHWWIRPNS